MSQSLLGGILSATYNPLAGSPSTVEYLVVAGGGGGGGYNTNTFGTGGGGAGGLLTAASFAVASGTALTVTVGAGGAGGSDFCSPLAVGRATHQRSLPLADSGFRWASGSELYREPSAE